MADAKYPFKSRGNLSWTARIDAKAPGVIETVIFDPVIQGVASGQFSITGAATAAVAVSGAASSTMALDGAATGTVASSGINGSASGDLALTGSATAVAPVSGSASGSLGLTGSGAGVAPVAGAGAGSLPLTGTATGTGPITGSVVGSFDVTGTATGTVPGQVILYRGDDAPDWRKQFYDRQVKEFEERLAEIAAAEDQQDAVQEAIEAFRPIETKAPKVRDNSQAIIEALRGLAMQPLRRKDLQIELDRIRAETEALAEYRKRKRNNEAALLLLL